MITRETSQKITTIHQRLETLNHEINVELDNLRRGENFSTIGHDRDILLRIREENIKTLQLIDHMIYTGEAMYDDQALPGGDEQ